ncbi:hypothetical protein ACFLQU_00690 [Verrucomicrobiota bacterium]
MKRVILLYAFAAALGAARTVLGQAEDEAQQDGRSLETLIVDRMWALRLRAELQFTADDDELIDQDTSYASFPTELYTVGAKFYENKSGVDYTLQYSTWENEQGLSAIRWSWRLRAPVTHGKRPTRVAVKYSLIDDDIRRHYLYLSADKSLTKGVYGTIQYRAAIDDEEGWDGHQLYEYISWMPTSRLRIGQQGAISHDEGSTDLRPAYSDLFATLFLLPPKTSLRLKIRHYDSTEDFNYREYHAYLYQKVTQSAWIRLSYRFYEDNESRRSDTYGIKAKYFFTARGAAHIGYRQYEHSEEADFGTAFVGGELLL